MEGFIKGTKVRIQIEDEYIDSTFMYLFVIFIIGTFYALFHCLDWKFDIDAGYKRELDMLRKREKSKNKKPVQQQKPTNIDLYEQALDLIYKNKNGSPFEQFTPCEVNKIGIEMVNFQNYYKGLVDDDSQFTAKTEWEVHYNCETYYNNELKKTDLKIFNVNCVLNLEECWTKDMICVDLLTHEFGHYLFGCLLAIRFKFRIEQYTLPDSNTKGYIESVFTEEKDQIKILESYYDSITNHGDNKHKQRDFNIFLTLQMKTYYEFYWYQQRKTPNNDKANFAQENYDKKLKQAQEYQSQVNQDNFQVVQDEEQQVQIDKNMNLNQDNSLQSGMGLSEINITNQDEDILQLDDDDQVAETHEEVIRQTFKETKEQKFTLMKQLFMLIELLGDKYAIYFIFQYILVTGFSCRLACGIMTFIIVLLAFFESRADFTLLKGTKLKLYNRYKFFIHMFLHLIIFILFLMYIGYNQSWKYATPNSNNPKIDIVVK